MLTFIIKSSEKLTIILTVVQSTVVDNKLEVSSEFSKRIVLAIVKFLLHFQKIHWSNNYIFKIKIVTSREFAYSPFNYGVVTRSNVLFYGIHKGPSIIVIFHMLKNFMHAYLKDLICLHKAERGHQICSC